LETACRLDDMSIGVEPIEASVAIGLQNATEGMQGVIVGAASGDLDCSDSAPPAVQCRHRAAHHADTPKSVPSWSCRARSQHRHRCVVGVEAVTRDDMPLQRVDQRAQQGEDLANPVGKGRAFQRGAGAGIDVALAIQRQVIAELRRQHVRKQSGARPATADWQGWCRRLGDRLAGPARELHTHMANDAERGRPIVQHLAHVLAETAEFWTVAAVATAQGVSPKTVRKWRDRYVADGEAGLADRSSRPHRSPRQLAAPTEAEIITLRHDRLSSPAIARRLGRPVSTIGAVLRRHRLGRPLALTPRPPVIRYERDQPGELIHIDTKKLGRIDGIGHRITGDRTGQSKHRGIGWEFVHVAIDDASRLAYTELLNDERKESAVAFTARAIDWFARHGVTVERIMTDNGSAYRSHAFRALLGERAVKHRRTRPYTPRTNGKAERFIQTSLREWAYAQPFQTSAERATDPAVSLAATSLPQPQPPTHTISSQASPVWPGSSLAQRPPKAAWA
jgi:transposase InsO family protein